MKKKREWKKKNVMNRKRGGKMDFGREDENEPKNSFPRKCISSSCIRVLNAVIVVRQYRGCVNPITGHHSMFALEEKSRGRKKVQHKYS